MQSVLAALQRERDCGESDAVRQERTRTLKKQLPCTSSALWLKLRMPFVLPPSAYGHHTCEWEVFGSGMAGCRLCGTVHTCKVGSCKHFVESEDSEICVITGLCLRGLRAQGEFVDTCIGVNNPNLEGNDGGIVPDYNVVSGFVEELLLSDKAEQCFHMQQVKTQQKLFKQLQLQMRSEQNNLVDVVAQAVQKSTTRLLCMAYVPAQREQMVSSCSRIITDLLRSSHAHVNLNLKVGDRRNTIFGLVFLLRQGIYVGGACIVPRIAFLDMFLPSEALLERVFNFRAKYITDIENKCKYAFRLAGEGPGLRSACLL